MRILCAILLLLSLPVLAEDVAVVVDKTITTNDAIKCQIAFKDWTGDNMVISFGDISSWTNATAVTGGAFRVKSYRVTKVLIDEWATTSGVDSTKIITYQDGSRARAMLKAAGWCKIEE
jgi:hypothetical protein